MRSLRRILPARRDDAGRPARPFSNPEGGAPRPGPGPSRLSYRLSRIWMKVWVRRVAAVLPVVLIVLVAIRMAASPEVRGVFAEKWTAAIAALSQRPAFAVRGIHVTGASHRLSGAIRQVADLAPGASSLTVNVDAIQARVAAMGGVRNARVALAPDGALRIAVDERVPEALWRDDEGRLWLVGRHGVAIHLAGARADYPALPVVIGEGSQAAMEEALALFRAAPDLHPRLRALVRVGKRRWDVVLDHDLRIMLPASGAATALARVMALQYGEELLDRDLAAIDMRLGDRPTLRLTPRAREAMQWRNAASDKG